MIGLSSVAGLLGECDSCHISCSASPSCTAAKGEMYFQVKHISMDMDMMCQLIQIARLDGDAMIITDLLPATQAQDQQHQDSSGAEADTINGFKMRPASQ